MRAGPVRPGFEIQARTTALAGRLFKVLDQRLAGAGRTFGIIRYQVVDIEAAPDVRIFEFAENSQRHDPISADGHAHFRAVAEYSLHFLCIIARQLRA